MTTIQRLKSYNEELQNKKEELVQKKSQLDQYEVNHLAQFSL